MEFKIIKNVLEYVLVEEFYKFFYKYSVLKFVGYLYDDVIVLVGFNFKKESVVGFVWKVMELFEFYGECA